MKVESIDHLAPRVPKPIFEALFVPRVAWKLTCKRKQGIRNARLSKAEMRCTAFEVRCIWYLRCLREKTSLRKRARKNARAKARRLRRRHKRMAKLRSLHQGDIDKLLARSKSWYQQRFVPAGETESATEGVHSPGLSVLSANLHRHGGSPTEVEARGPRTIAPEPVSVQPVEERAFAVRRDGEREVDLIRSFYAISNGTKVAELFAWSRLYAESKVLLSNAYGETVINKAAVQLSQRGYTIALAVVDSRMEYLSPFLEWVTLSRMWLDCFLRSGHPGFWRQYVLCLSEETLQVEVPPDRPVFMTHPNASLIVHKLSQSRWFLAHRVKRVGEEVLIASLELRFKMTRDWSRRFSSQL